MAIELDYQNQKITVNGTDIIDINGLIPANVVIAPSGAITTDTLESALEQLADQIFYTETIPVSVYLREGALWYKNSTLTLSVYREISPGVFEWTPIYTGTDNSDTLDGGAF